MTLVEVVMALAITGLTVAGIVEGYIFCMASSVKDSLFMAANGQALAGIEATRSAQWDTSNYPVVDQLVATNFPAKVVTLNQSGTDTNLILATVTTDISQISTTPPLRRIYVECVWQFKGGEWVTNTIETIRAPDQ
jgi:type II secretory pathway pseudopilin PulG